MASVEDALISIRPNFANAILAGKKTVEIRRRIPALKVGTRLWIYATQPLGAIVGTAIVEKVIEDTPTELWKTCMDQIALGQCEYDEYFAGTDRALGIVLSKITKWEPISIDKLRKIREGFHPPRVLLRLSRQETHSLSKLAIADD